LIVLALDTALGACSVAVTNGGRLCVALSEPMTRGHQERLAPMVAEAMNQAGLEFTALDRIAVCVGPGSFTGVRVGVAFAKGLAMALDAPCVGVGALEALAAETGEGPVAAVVDGRRGQLYLQCFDDGRALTEPAAVEVAAGVAQIRTVFGTRTPRFLGTGADALALELGGAVELRTAPDPVVIARLALLKSAQGAAAPIYLRPPDARTLAERAS
jgi:tRNA threonylcarbamoyladenosine biosynthesis protein TsaB